MLNRDAFEALIFWFPAFLFSTTVHEAAHAWAALRGGDPTAYLGGQVSLNPWPHIRRSPIGMLVVPILTAITQGWAMGWAAAPYDALWAHRFPRRAALMAAAGPAGNVVLAVISGLLLKLGLALRIFVSPERVNFSHLADPAPAYMASVWCPFAAKLLAVMLVLNALLAAFNLLPLPPLDGATVITLPLPENAARTVRGISTSPAMAMIGILVAWRAFPYIAGPLFRFVVNCVYPGVYGF